MAGPEPVEDDDGRLVVGEDLVLVPELVEGGPDRGREPLQLARLALQVAYLDLLLL